MQNTSTSRSTDFRRQKTITSKAPLTLYGRGFCASDRTPTTTGSPAGPQSNQNVWVLPPISRNEGLKRKQTFGMRKVARFRPTSTTLGRSFSSCGFYSSAAYVQLEFGESAASIRVRLLIKCGLYTRLYGLYKKALSKD